MAPWLILRLQETCDVCLTLVHGDPKIGDNAFMFFFVQTSLKNIVDLVGDFHEHLVRTCKNPVKGKTGLHDCYIDLVGIKCREVLQICGNGRGGPSPILNCDP